MKNPNERAAYIKPKTETVLCDCCYKSFPLSALNVTLGYEQQFGHVCDPCKDEIEYAWCESCQAYHYQGDCPNARE